MRMFRNFSLTASLIFSALFAALPAAAQTAAHPGARTIMDAHNCYPYYEWWYGRIDRALSAGTPLAIEQDLYWYTDPKTGKSESLVAHGVPVSGHEPTMEHYFFDRVRPIVEQALKDGDHGDWPLITPTLTSRRKSLSTSKPSGLSSANIRIGSRPPRKQLIRSRRETHRPSDSRADRRV